MYNSLKNIKNFIKKNRFLYLKLTSILVTLVRLKNKCIYILKSPFQFLLRNRSLFNLNKTSNLNKNIFIFDTRIHSVIFDSVVLLIRGSNFFYNDKWTLIIYEDDNYRYSEEIVTKEIYFNSLINIFLQSLLILPNPPLSIKFINNSNELLGIMKTSNKIFPKNYNFLIQKKPYLIRDFNQKDFQNFQINKPILKASEYHSKIFENYLNYRNIKNYITITVRTKSWATKQWNTDIEDIKLYLNFIKNNNLINYDILILPDTQEDLPKELVNLIKKNNLSYHLYHHGSFSIPMRFLAYSKSSFNLGSSNGPCILLSFIKNHSFLILKDPHQDDDYIEFADKINKNIFLDRKIIFHKRY
jgi:hypothetical protein